ncbi:hypothetical protein NSMS1_42020 [Nostoc sp. MS1]|nr:hypothetical protein NSMS1_31660 [Nostoc sp. MS1]BCL37755.1 hypothetical protein NSMS1_42020 [Nostoc sp. MS1]
MRQLNQIILAMLAMSGRVTMLGIARWTDTGGSYRTMGRFFSTVIPWATLFWLFFRKHVVILVKTNLKTNTASHVILFSSDLDLTFEKIIDYYKLRFHSRV